MGGWVDVTAQLSKCEDGAPPRLWSAKSSATGHVRFCLFHLAHRSQRGKKKQRLTWAGTTENLHRHTCPILTIDHQTESGAVASLETFKFLEFTKPNGHSAPLLKSLSWESMTRVTFGGSHSAAACPPNLRQHLVWISTKQDQDRAGPRE